MPFPDYPERSCYKQRGRTAGYDTERHRDRKGAKRGKTEQLRHDDDGNNCDKRCKRGYDISYLNLIDTVVYKLADFHSGIEPLVFTDSVVNNYGIVQRVAENRKHHRDIVRVDLKPEDNAGKKCDQHVEHQRYKGGYGGWDTSYAAEAYTDIYND